LFTTNRSILRHCRLQTADGIFIEISLLPQKLKSGYEI